MVQINSILEGKVGDDNLVSLLKKALSTAIKSNDTNQSIFIEYLKKQFVFSDINLASKNDKVKNDIKYIN